MNLERDVDVSSVTENVMFLEKERNHFTPRFNNA